jgi:ABC-type phosphate transport system auxiliary subunit
MAKQLQLLNYNSTLAIKVRMLLYAASGLFYFWAAAILQKQLIDGALKVISHQPSLGESPTYQIDWLYLGTFQRWQSFQNKLRMFNSSNQ